MLHSYLQIAWKVLLRRKFFAFVNIFGVALTITLIMVVSAIADSYLFPNGPEKTSSNFLVADYVTYTNEERSSVQFGPLSYQFIKDNILRLKTPEMLSLNNGRAMTAIYKGQDKYVHYVRRTDANYWTLLDFELLQGRTFTQKEFEQGEMIAVISRSTAERHYPNNAIGEYINVNSQRFKIVGVVEDVAQSEEVATADIYLPYTTLVASNINGNLPGGWQVILYHSDSRQLKLIQEEYVHLLKHDVILPEGTNETIVFTNAFSKLESIARDVFFGNVKFSYESGVGMLVAVCISILFLIMLLPSINMINLNVSRILERASEIGVRKSFGASSNQLVLQFVVENIVLTLIGGALGLLFSVYVLDLIEASGVIPYAEFTLNLRLFIWAVIITLIFGVIAGTYPAYKMSRLNPVDALKGGI